MSVILVVDDTVEIAELVVDILEDAGHAAMHVASYDEAARVIAEREVSLVFLDTIGDARTELLPKIAAPRPPIVLFSAWSTIEERARALGAEGWLAKPFAMDELLATVTMHARHDPALRTGTTETGQRDC
jgi:DNA-binding response OmpR family regulator